MKRKNSWIDSIQSSTYDITNYGNFFINIGKDDYFEILPKDIDVLKMVQENLNMIDNEAVKSFLIKIINIVQNTLLNITESINSRVYLSPIIFDQDEDGSVYLEWIFQGFRIGFSIHKKIEDSSWYLIKEIGKGINVSSGLLDEDNLLIIITNIINYVVENS